MYDLRKRSTLRFLIAPFGGMFLIATVLLVILMAASGWFWLIALLYFVWIEWRASRLGLSADESGITVVNLLRRYKVAWEEVRGIWADEGYPGPAAVRIERRRGRLWSVSIHATFGLGRKRRRSIALRLAELGRAYGYGFVTGDGAEVVELRKAGLWEVTDPAAHQAWWDARAPHAARDD